MGVFIRVGLTAIALAASAQSARAETYQLAAFPFTYMGATAVQSALSSNSMGTFAGKVAIEQFLNGASFTAVLSGQAGPLASLNNANSAWTLNLQGAGAAATLSVSQTGMTLTFETPSESSSAALVLRSTNSASVFQFRQENNVTDYAFVNFSHDAMFTANYSSPYNTSFFLQATPVDEPPAYLLGGIGLFLVASSLQRRASRA